MEGSLLCLFQLLTMCAKWSIYTYNNLCVVIIHRGLLGEDFLVAKVLLEFWFLLLHDKISLSTIGTHNNTFIRVSQLLEELRGKGYGYSLWIQICTTFEVQLPSIDVKSTQYRFHLWRNKILILHSHKRQPQSLHTPPS